MSCGENFREELSRIWLESEEGRKKTIEGILRRLGYENVQSTKAIPGENVYLISGDYKREYNSTHGAFVSYLGKENGEHVEISAEKRTAERIERMIKEELPQIDCKIESTF